MRLPGGRSLTLAVVLTLAVALLTKSGPPAGTPNPPGSFSFAVLGDAPYYFHEDLRYRLVLRSLDAHELSSIIHIGDIFWRPCSDTMYVRNLDRFNDLRHPVIFTPGDNEWTDCWEPGSGGFAPLERLNRIRQIFFAVPTRSLGSRRIALISQGSEFVENVRWEQQRVVFATIHLVGSRNGTKPFPGRTAADDEEATRRTGAAVTWVRETFAAATATDARAVVLGFHASLAIKRPVGHHHRQPYEPFIAALEEEVERFRKPVLVVHGDDHQYVVDHPLQRLANFTRMQVPGSPDVGWVRVVVTPDAKSPFAFEEHVVPRWKYW